MYQRYAEDFGIHDFHIHPATPGNSRRSWQLLATPGNFLVPGNCFPGSRRMGCISHGLDLTILLIQEASVDFLFERKMSFICRYQKAAEEAAE